MDLPADHSAALTAQAGPANLVFLLGAPRSGTTWLAKLFDSHPNVLYRNEPDSVLHEPRVPLLCQPEDIARYRAIAHDYIERLLEIRTLKTSGSLPVFAKHFTLPLADPLRRLWIYTLHLAAAVPAGKGLAERLPIPDLRRAGAHPTVVMKSVNARGLARLFLEAMPDCRMVFILRHPCGQIGSVVRGLASGVFAPPDRTEVLATAQARQLGLTPERFAALEPVEQWAWHWAILNQKAHDELASSPRVKFVIYEDLAANPQARVREAFDFCGLDWAPQAAEFLAESTTYTGKSGYYGVKRDSLAAAQKWRAEVPEDAQRRIIAIAREVPVGRLLTDTAPEA
jgi:hypothetical protein